MINGGNGVSLRRRFPIHNHFRVRQAAASVCSVVWNFHILLFLQFPPCICGINMVQFAPVTERIVYLMQVTMQSDPAEGYVSGMANPLISTRNVEICSVIPRGGGGTLSRVPTLRSRHPAHRSTIRRVAFGRGSRYPRVEGHATLAPRVTLPLGQRSRYLCPEGHVTLEVPVL